MRTLKILAAVVLLSVVSAVSFNAGCWITKNQVSQQMEKDFQAACLLGDVLHILSDSLGPKVDEIYNDYMFDIEDNAFIVVTKDELEEYYFGY